MYIDPSHPGTQRNRSTEHRAESLQLSDIFMPQLYVEKARYRMPDAKFSVKPWD